MPETDNRMVWLICRATDKSCLTADLSNGVKGLFVFTDMDKALAFRQAEGLDDTYSVIGQKMADLANDLPRHFKAGLTHSLVDVQSGSLEIRAAAMLSTLMELDKGDK